MTPHPRVAIVTTSFPAYRGDAAGHFVEAEATALAATGHEVTVICPGEGVAQETRYRVVRLPDGGACGWPGVTAKLREQPLRAIGLFRWIAAARAELVARAPFDRVIAHWLVPCAFPIALAVAASGSKHLEVVVHGSDARWVARLPPLLRARLMRALIERKARFRCVSAELARMLQDMAGGARGALCVTVAPATIALEGAPDRARARELLALDAGARLVVIVGRLVATKRVADAIAAALLVPETDIVVVGDGPEEASLRARFPNVRFVGHVPRERALVWVAAADVLLSASRLEGAPTVIREARALGVRVVAAAAGDLVAWAERDPQLFVVQ